MSESDQISQLKQDALPLVIDAFNCIDDQEQLERLMRAVSLASRGCLGNITLQEDEQKQPVTKHRVLEGRSVEDDKAMLCFFS